MFCVMQIQYLKCNFSSTKQADPIEKMSSKSSPLKSWAKLSLCSGLLLSRVAAK